MNIRLNKIFTLLTCFFLVSCASEPVEYKANYYSLNPFINGNNEIVDPLYTNVTLIMYTQEDIENNYKRFEEDIVKIHKAFDRDSSYAGLTNLKDLNDIYGKVVDDKPVSIEVDPMLVETLKVGVEMTNLTDGYFNIAMGNLIDVYGSKFDFFGVVDYDPDSSLIQEAINNIPSVDEVNSMFSFESNKVTFNKIENKDVVISLGGISKGYAIDKESSYFITKSKSAIISCGSSSIATINNNPLKDKWSIALRLPNIDFGLEIAFTINLKGTNYLSTSADNEKNYFVEHEDGSRTIRHHILNPYTGYSENYHRQVFLTSTNTSGTVLDALSTALMNIETIDEIKAVISRVENYYSSKIDFAVFDNSTIEGKYDIYLSSDLKNSISGELSDQIENLITC